MDVEEALDTVATGRAAGPLTPVTFVAPSRLAALTLRRRLAARGPFAAVRFEPLARLAEIAGAGSMAAAGRKPLARPIGDYAAGVVAGECGGPLSRVAGLPGYARVLRRMFQRLRRGGITHSTMAALSGADDSSAEFLRAYDRFRDLTAAFYDAEDLLEAAAAAAVSGRSGVVADLGDIYVVPPTPRTHGEHRFLEALAQSGAGLTQVEGGPGEARSPRIELLPDAAAEADWAARAVLQLLEGGAGLHEIVVFHGSDPVYGPLLSSALERARVPAVRHPGRPLVEMPAGRAALMLARLPAEDYSRRAVMDLLALGQSPWRLPGGARGDVVPRPAAWDRLSRSAGVTHGAGRWASALDAQAARFAKEMADPEAPSWVAGRAEDIDATRDLAGIVETLVGALEPLRQAQPAESFIATFRGAMDRFIRADAPGRGDVMDEVEQLGTVAAVGGTFTLEQFAWAFEANLSAAVVRGRPLDAGVLVADFSAAAGPRPKHVVLVGAREGAFPGTVRAEPLLPDAWWSELRAAHPFVEDRADRIEAASKAAWRSLDAASESLSISVPLASAAGMHDCYPAAIVVALARRDHPGLTGSKMREGEGVAKAWRSPLAASARGVALDDAEFELRVAIRRAQAGLEQVPAGHRLGAAIAMRKGRREDGLSAYRGLVSTGGPLLGQGQLLSATSLEEYATCGFKYFCRSVLRLRPLEEPEERDTMEAGTRGTIVHLVLERFFRAEHERGRPRPGESWTAADRNTVLAILDEELAVAETRGETGLPIFAANERAALRADLGRFLDEDSALRAELGLVPARFEWAFRDHGIGGRLFRGGIDRVDIAHETGARVVIDYKTGKNREKPDGPFDAGKRLQLGVYASAVSDGRTDTRGIYWYVTTRGGFDRVEYSHDAGNAARLDSIVGAIADGVNAGVFPPVPGDEYFNTYENCRYCDFTRVCSRRRQAEAQAAEAGSSTDPWRRVGEAAVG